MKPNRGFGSRGFTLVELMISVAIVGLLSSVAIPNFSRMTLRAKSAERASVIVALARAIGTTIQNAQQIPNINGSTPATWTGAWNPPGAISSTKRIMNWAMLGWSTLPLVVEGSCYYSYFFHVTDTNLWLAGQGDLDGDGIVNTAVSTYPVVGYAIQAPVLAVGGGEF